MTVTAGGTADAVTLDFANGNPFASATTVTGNATAVTTLAVTGLNGTAVQVGPSAVTVGSAAVSCAAVQGITVVGSAANDSLTQPAQPAAPVVFAGGGGADTLAVDAGTFTLAGDPAAATSNLTVNDAGWLYLTAATAGAGVNAPHLAGLNVLAGGEAVVDTLPNAAVQRDHDREPPRPGGWVHGLIRLLQPDHGRVRRQPDVQGYGATSAWSRGSALDIYGFS